MEYIVGISIGAAVGVLGSVVGFDKERSFYPVVLIVVATYYFLFAAMASSMDAILAEALPAFMFVAAASIGFRKALWLVVAGLALHGAFDFIHHAVIVNPGVPVWWPGFCGGADVSLAAYSGALLVFKRARNQSDSALDRRSV